MSKLNSTIVARIRAEYTGARGQLRQLAKKYHLSTIQMSRVCRGVVWKDPTYKNKYDKSSALRQDWVPIPGFPNYLINSLGQIWFLGRKGWGPYKPRLLRSTALRDRRGKIHYVPRARLLLLAFVGPPPNKKSQARHLDDVRSNMALSNLAWGSAKDNHDDGVRNGKHPTKGTPEAFARNAFLKGKPRPEKVKRKISQTKRLHPERQYFGGRRNSLGRFTGAPR